MQLLPPHNKKAQQQGAPGIKAPQRQELPGRQVQQQGEPGRQAQRQGEPVRQAQWQGEPGRQGPGLEAAE